MKSTRSRNAGSFFLSTASLAPLGLALLLSACASPSCVASGADNRFPDVPDPIKVPAGNGLHFHAYAVGVQIYVWTIDPSNGLGSWVFRAPAAVLFADAGGNGQLGIHYAGPTWESESGSKVLGLRVAGATVDATAIPWLLLKAGSAQGPGIFNHTTYIQRINTMGGLAPSMPGSATGQEARIPYTAEYFFYREIE
jgi:hypothetical protein